MMSPANAPDGVEVTTEPADVTEYPTLARFETVCTRMPRIAEAIEAFADPTLRERAYHELIRILNPSPDEPAPVDLIAAPQWGDAPASAAEIGKLASWICDDAPSAWRDSIQPGESTVDAAIRFLEDGDKARAALILIRRELVEQGGFSAEQAEGDLIPLIRELAADPPVTDPELERLAAQMRAGARPGETAVQAATRLLDTGADARRGMERLWTWLLRNLPDDAAKVNGDHTAVDVAIDLLREFRQSLLTPQEKVDDRERSES